MGKSYLFECSKCGYRAVACGGVADGRDLRVQTVLCKDCRSIYDCVIGLRAVGGRPLWKQFDPLSQDIAPSLESVLKQLPLSPQEATFWKEFELACPKEATHRVEPWTSPGRCPRCRAYIEGGGLPYRAWD